MGIIDLISYHLITVWERGFPDGAGGKGPACQCREYNETWVWSLGQEDPLEKGMTTHSNILAWRIPWKEEPGMLQPMGLQSWTWPKWLSTYALPDCHLPHRVELLHSFILPAWLPKECELSMGTSGSPNMCGDRSQPSWVGLSLCIFSALIPHSTTFSS